MMKTRLAARAAAVVGLALMTSAAPAVAAPAKLVVAQAVAPTPKSAADLDYAAYQKATQARPAKPVPEMTPREFAQFIEARALEMRTRAMAFLAAYPGDPRRWEIVSRLEPSSPAFVLEWVMGEDGHIIRAAVDEAAAAAWKSRVERLKSEMKTASDVPEDVRRMVAQAEQMQAKKDGFMTRWSSGRNELAPDFPLHDLVGKPLKLSDFRGKVVVLDFWASWCVPCKASFPRMQEFAKKYARQGVVVLGAATGDRKEDFEKYLRENQHKFPNIRWARDASEGEASPASFKLYDVTGIPTQFVIDRKGRVVQGLIGGGGEANYALDAALAKAGIKVDQAILAKAEEQRNRRARD